jgi:phosphoribosylanthranilate isomerase
MSKCTIYTDDIRKSTRKKLPSARRLADELLDTLEGQEFEVFQGQSMEALKSLLHALSQAIQMHEEQELRTRNSLRKRG